MAGLHQPAIGFMVDQIDQPPHRKGTDRYAVSHRLQGHQRQPFKAGSDAEQVDVVPLIGHVLETMKLDAITILLQQAAFHGAIPVEMKRPVRAEGSQLAERLRPLFRREAADKGNPVASYRSRRRRHGDKVADHRARHRQFASDGLAYCNTLRKTRCGAIQPAVKLQQTLPVIPAVKGRNHRFAGEPGRQSPQHPGLVAVGMDQHRSRLAGQTAHKIAAVLAHLVGQALLFEQGRKGGHTVVAHQHYGGAKSPGQQIVGQVDNVNFYSTDLTRIDGQPDLLHG